MLVAVTAVTMAQDTRKFSVSDFDKLSMGSAFRIEVKQGKEYSVVTSGRREDLDDLSALVKGGVLKLGYKSGGWNNNHKSVTVNITMPTLEGVDFSGASRANVSAFTGAKQMVIEVSGASQVTMDFSAPKVTFDLSGASSLILTGSCNVLNGEVSGASSFKGRDFSSKEVNIDASGASSAYVMASNVIHAEASGASRVRYSGAAKDIHSSSSGASSVKRD
ncbi:hypothetical protein DYBT9275_00128 [Dyadobacter sp. CECT 9275]|uniref:Putative auto-transporter adhesin head GIN domain-containing protein n=2 Tax=Dyadobacter helix TaxID=2822344 RepID=A0A916J9F0_9BACT|nr:hypothetical protein DYBT9275_00128 [Dyadobacter sp. CECT 9275]